MAVTPTNVKEILPEFSALTDSTVQPYLDQANRRVSDAAWGATADEGVIYLTGYLLSLREEGDSLAPGPVSSEKVLSVASSYAVSGKLSASALGATAHGRYFLDLRSSVFGARKL